MISTSRLRVRHATLAVVLVLATGCGSSDDSSPSASDTVGEAEPAETVADAEPADTVAAAEPAETVADAEPAETTPAPTPEPETEPAGAGEMSIVLDDGRSWSLDADMCSFDPDATGPAAAIVNIGGSNADGVELNMLDAWPLDGSTETGTAFIANFVDENDDLYLLVDGVSTMVGDEVQVTAGYHTDLMYQDGDAPEGSVVVTCTP